MSARALIALLMGMVALVIAAPAHATVARVTATVETDPTHNPGDAADDAAIWVHPSDPALSTVIGADKDNNPELGDPSVGSGLSVYDLAGHELYFHPDNRLNNVDLRYGFPLGSARVALVGATNRDHGRVDFWKVNPSDRSLTSLGSLPTSAAIKTPRGFALYHSPISGRYYAFVTDRGHTDQYELNGASGQLSWKLVRQMLLPDATEGLAADDDYGRLYVAEETNKTETGATTEDGGITRYGAEPGDPTTGVRIESIVDAGGNIVPDVKGLSIYCAAGGHGYLIAASQGSDSFHLYDRGDNAHLGEFKIVDSGTIDGVTDIDGIDVTSFSLGPAFPNGFFISQDDLNPGFNQNYKLVPWESIAGSLGLWVDNRYDPLVVRTPGTRLALPDPTPPPAPSPPPPPPPPPPAPPSPPSPPVVSPPAPGPAFPPADEAPAAPSTESSAPEGAAPGDPDAESAAAATGKAAIALRIARTRLRGGKLHVRGTLGMPTLSRVVVVFSGRAGGQRVRVKRRALVYHGRYHAILPLRRGARRPRGGVVSVRWPGDRGHIARRARRAVAFAGR